MDITKLERYLGAMLAVLCGDALGAPYETLKAALIEAIFAERGGLTAYDYVEPFKQKRTIRRGHPTDDCELDTAGGFSLVKCGGFNAADYYFWLRGFIHGNDPEVGRISYLTDGKAYGSGGTLRSALRPPSYELSLVAFREGRVRVLPTNGGLMRNTSAALSSDDLDTVIEIARCQSCVTHIHPASQVACITHAIVIHYALQGLSPVQCWQKAREQLERLLANDMATPDKVLVDDLKAVLSMPVTRPEENEIWPHTGEVLISLRIALWAFLTADDFRDGLTKAISVGGDTDTYAAIAGGMLGAHFGIGGIPQEWQDVMIGKDIRLDLARKLYDLSHR